MPIQILCPQQHLLEVPESQAGQPCQCPICGMTMIVPPLPGYAPQTPAGYAPMAQPGVAGGWQSAPAAGFGQAAPSGWPHSPAPAEMAYGQPAAAPEVGFPGVGPTAGFPQVETPAVEAPAVGEQPQETRIVRVLCPNNHELHTPMDMIGMDAMCPQCSVQFRLRFEDSLEYKEERRQAQERREQRFSKAALNWAIVAAVVVVVALIGMVVLSQF